MSRRLASHLALTCILTLAVNGYGKLARAAEDDELATRLAAAVGALETDPANADTLLATIEAGPLPDYVYYFQGVAKQALRDDAGARERFERVVATRSTSPVAPKAAARLAPLLLAAGETNPILRLAESYAPESPASIDGAVLALAAGKALADAQPRRAAEWLMRARRLAPGSAPGSEATSLLSDLRRFSSELRPSSPQDMLEEARLAVREGDTRGAQSVLDAIVSRHPHDPLAVDAALLRARTIAGEKGRAEAAAWLEERAERTASRAAKARLLVSAATDRWNIDDTRAAQTILERVVTLGSAAEAQRAHYTLGRIHESDARYAAAAVSYAKASSGPDAQVTRESRWRAGWVAYRAADFSLAASRFAEITSAPSADESAREEALYWQARALENAADMPRSQILYRQLIEAFPDGFYAYLAEQRARTSAPPMVLAGSQAADVLSPGSSAAIERAKILETARLHDYAVAELRAALAGSPASEQRALLPALMRIGAYAQAVQTALGLFRRGELSEEQLSPYLYPHAFADVVEREAKSRGIDPYLVYSLIRQESLFDHRAVSVANACGLMQLLVPTARRMAAGDARLSTLVREDLFKPDVNIRLGVAYLADLARRFDGKEVLMLAAYNAGEQAAERWRSRFGTLAPDEFIEQISYRETRDYVKKVLRNYRNYRRLYGNTGSGALAQNGE